MLIDNTANLGNECLTAVSGFSYLKALDITARPSFHGISSLKNMTSLEELAFMAPESYGVTDEAVMQLSTLTNLKSLMLAETAVTPDGRNRLSQLLPSCKIETAQDWR